MLDEDRATVWLQSFPDLARWWIKWQSMAGLGTRLEQNDNLTLAVYRCCWLILDAWWCLEIAYPVLLMRSGMSERPFSARVILQFIINPVTELYAFWTTLLTSMWNLSVVWWCNMVSGMVMCHKANQVNHTAFLAVQLENVAATS